MLVDGVFVKDLTVLGRDLSRVVIVDNAVEAFALQVIIRGECAVHHALPINIATSQINNGIPIKTWTEDTHDNEMIRLHWFLQTLKKQTDVRPFLWQSFAMERRISAAARLHGLCS